VILLLAAAALVALSGQAPAAAPAPLAAGPDVMGDFQNFCVAHRGDQKAPIAAAEAAGFMAVPTAMLSQLPANLQHVEARAKVAPGGLEFVFTGDGDLPLTGKPGHAVMCMVGGQPAEYAAVAMQAGTIAKTQPVQATDQQTIYVFTDGPGGRKSLDIADDAGTAAAMKAGSATVLLVKSFKRGAMLGYAVPTL
jgi:hypothetical protein